MEEPFDPATKYMMVQGHFHDNRPIYFAKGALTSILSLCTHYLLHSGPVPLDEHSIKMIERANDTMSSEGLRVLACAFGEHATGLTFAGLVAMHDVPRPGIDDCIGTLIGMGVQIVMITGDSGMFLFLRPQKLRFFPQN